MPELFKFVPSRVSEVLSFYTDVRAAAAQEWRDGLRPATPRLRLEIIEVDPNIALEVKSFCDLHRLEGVLVPNYGEMHQIDAALVTGASILPYPTSSSDWAVGQQVALLYRDAAELHTIASGTGDELTIEGTLAADWPVGTLVVPVVNAIMPSALGVSYQYNRTTFTIEFLVTDVRDLELELATVHPDGLNVWTEAPLLAGGVGASHGRELDLYRTEHGAYSIQPVEDYNRRRGTLRAAKNDRTERYALKRWLHYLRGRDRPFWLSRGVSHVITVAGSSSVQYANIARLDSIEQENELVGRSLMIVKDDGNRAYRTITSVSRVSIGSVRLNFSGGLGFSFNNGNAGLYILDRVRLDSDEIELRHAPLGLGRFLTSVDVPTVEVLP